MIQQKTKEKLEKGSIQKPQTRKPSSKSKKRQIARKNPTVSKREGFEKANWDEFPVKHYSKSAFVKFGSNPFMFKVNNINGEYLDVVSNPSGTLGTAVHKAMQAYAGGVENMVTPPDEGEAIKFGYEYGKNWLDNMPDGFIGYNTVIKNRADLEKKYSLTYFGYIKEFNLRARTKSILLIEKMLTHPAEAEGQYMPIPLKGSSDIVYRDAEGRMVIYDYKVTGSYSKENEVDGDKLVQAAFLYFLHKAEFNEEPHRIIFGEYKHIKNDDGSPQLKEFPFVYAESPLMFDLFYRYYHDVTQALLGQQVFVPNLQSRYDREVSILGYVNYLDVDAIREEAFKKAKVQNITDFLKKRIQKDSTMKRYMSTVTSKFISAETLNYKDMEIQDRIKMKLAEHGIAVEYQDKVVGSSVALYRFEPSIGVKMSRIDDYVRDLEQVTATTGMRVLAPIPGSELIGFEVPLAERTFPGAAPAPEGFDLALGIDIFGTVKRMDIREAPHILVAGSTGAGKSVFLDALISQIAQIPNVELILLDPKMVELFKWKDKARIYHDSPKEIAHTLTGLVNSMEETYSLLQKQGRRNIDGSGLPYRFVVIDEYGDLALSKEKISAGKKKVSKLYASGVQEMEEETFENAGEIATNAVKKLAQKARAAGIHIILTTQRPSVKIIDGDIKANFPTRIAFRTASVTDSQVILDAPGAEKLLGKGDMLVSDAYGITRLQGFSN